VKLELLGSALFKIIKLSLPWLFVILVIVLATWQSPNVKQPLDGIQKSDRETVLMPGLSTKQITHLIARAAPNVSNSEKWSTELRNALEANHLESSHENICAMIAIINQVSSFESSPRIASLSDKALREHMAKLVATLSLRHHTVASFEAWLKHKPSIKNNYWRRLRTAKTQQVLDITYRKIIADQVFLPDTKANVLQDNAQLRDIIEDNNSIKTIGAMQVRVSFVVSIEEQRLKRALTLAEIWAIRDQLYTGKGGMYYGALLLLAYDGGYDKKLYRFADFNAGRYASRNAGFQATVAALLDKPVTTDGDLLIYDKQGIPTNTVSNSEKAINAVIQKYHLSLTTAQIHADLLQEKQSNFQRTPTYLAITQQYQQLTHKPVLFALVPNIVLAGEKTIPRLSTDKFTKMVNNRYQQCLKKQ